MRKLLPIVVLLLPLATDISKAQDGAVTVYCEDCRHPHQHPDDYVNHAFNQVYGPDAWMDFRQADDFFIVNPYGLSVYVDIDFQFLGIGFEGLRLPFWPTNMVKITLALPNGNIYQAIRSVFQTSLPVPANRYDDPAYGMEQESGSRGDGDEGEDESDYDTDMEEFEEPEFDGYEGVTGIEDPDENGDFTDPEWCEEC